MAKTYYQRRSDNIAGAATITIQTGVAPPDADYEPAALIDNNPAKVAKIDSTTGAWLFDFGSARRIDLVALIHHNFDAGADVKIQGNATDSWGAPTFSAAITIPAWLGTGTTRWPVNPWLYLVTKTGYSAAGFRYWRLVVTGNSQNLQLGEIVLSSAVRELNPNTRWGFKETTIRRIIEAQTAYGVSTIYSRGNRQWKLDADHPMSPTLHAEIQAHWEDADGRSYPWLLVPDILVNVCYLVRWAETTKETQYFDNNALMENKFVIIEVSRGLRPGN